MKHKYIISFFFFFATISLLSGCGKSQNDVLTLRICNWEEYIDEGDWDEEETINLETKNIIGVNSMLKDFEDWYEEEYNKKIKVEYSCFGSNEELYNQLTLGDTFDLVCPSEYMIMKLMAEDKLEPYSDTFFDKNKEQNYYSRGVSPYIEDFVSSVTVNDKSIRQYAAGYMWGTTGIVYNPERVTPEDASSWNLLLDSRFKRQVTMKDNVRDAYFAAVGILKSEELTNLAIEPYLCSDSNRAEQLRKEYPDKLRAIMNDSSSETIDAVEKLLQKGKDNFYSFESDSGKADMITGKVVANYQWSGDAVYSLDQAEEDGIVLNYSVPQECSNLWFDGWVMLKDGIGENTEKKEACEAFVNFLSQPDNVVRNMYYIGYTSVIAGGEDDTLFDYAKWCYEAEEDEEDTIDYDVSYFFGKSDCFITASADQAERQLYAQYPPEEVLQRCAIMEYFGPETTKKLNQMWINVRCFNPFRD